MVLAQNKPEVRYTNIAQQPQRGKPDRAVTMYIIAAGPCLPQQRRVEGVDEFCSLAQTPACMSDCKRITADVCEASTWSLRQRGRFQFFSVPFQKKFVLKSNNNANSQGLSYYYVCMNDNLYSRSSKITLNLVYNKVRHFHIKRAATLLGPHIGRGRRLGQRILTVPGLIVYISL